VGPIGLGQVVWLFGTRVAEAILASGQTDRINRPDIWMQAIRSNHKTSCATGAVHIWVPAFALADSHIFEGLPRGRYAQEVLEAMPHGDGARFGAWVSVPSAETSDDP
jgi:hypothetical protein